ncbi:protein wech-like [Haliotis asinina]|uniref:protein wech-like n=1 Tax=Haliotis asinina TaxID=109174 RepID=UPI00353267B0
MATSQKLTEHFLSCVICTEVFDNPCTLDCNHTFCRKCVIKYTKTKPEVISAKSLLCPFCKQMTKVSDPERPVEDWADDIKPCFLIQGLLDAFGPGCKDTMSCSYCKDDGETTPADVWCSICDDAFCQNCARVHNRIPATRHHDITYLSGEVKVRRKRKIMCREHSDEHIKFLCKDCKKAVCHTCCTILHRKCDQVVTIEAELQTMKNAITMTRAKLSTKQEQVKEYVEKQQSKVHSETARHEQMRSLIQSASRKAIDKINLKEKKLLVELKELSDQHIGQLNADVKSGELTVQMYQQEAELIDQALQSECDMDVYEMYQRCETGDAKAVEDADLKERRRIAKISFRQDSSELSRAIDTLQLGEFDILYEGVMDLEASPVLIDTINPRVEGDGNATDPFDMAMLVVNDTDTVVITDQYNNCIKSFYTRNSQPCYCRLSLNSQPWGLTKLSHNQVVVAVPQIKEIVTVGVNPDIVLLSTITTNKMYVGITSLTPSTLAASSQSPPCVDILDVTGNMLRSISPQLNGNTVLQFPNYLCTLRTGNILVSDRGSKCLMCLTPEGDEVFTFRPTGEAALKCPQGITSTCRGDILVTEISQHRVIRLTESGQFLGNILTDIKFPRGICVDGHDHMYVLSEGINLYTFVT